MAVPSSTYFPFPIHYCYPYYQNFGSFPPLNDQNVSSGKVPVQNKSHLHNPPFVFSLFPCYNIPPLYHIEEVLNCPRMFTYFSFCCGFSEAFRPKISADYLNCNSNDCLKFEGWNEKGDKLTEINIKKISKCIGDILDPHCKLLFYFFDENEENYCVSLNQVTNKNKVKSEEIYSSNKTAKRSKKLEKRKECESQESMTSDTNAHFEEFKNDQEEETERVQELVPKWYESISMYTELQPFGSLYANVDAIIVKEKSGKNAFLPHKGLTMFDDVLGVIDFEKNTTIKNWSYIYQKIYIKTVILHLIREKPISYFFTDLTNFAIQSSVTKGPRDVPIVCYKLITFKNFIEELKVLHKKNVKSMLYRQIVDSIIKLKQSWMIPYNRKRKILSNAEYCIDSCDFTSQDGFSTIKKKLCKSLDDTAPVSSFILQKELNNVGLCTQNDAFLKKEMIYSDVREQLEDKESDSSKHKVKEKLKGKRRQRIKKERGENVEKEKKDLTEGGDDDCNLNFSNQPSFCLPNTQNDSSIPFDEDHTQHVVKTQTKQEKAKSRKNKKEANCEAENRNMCSSQALSPQNLPIRKNKHNKNTTTTAANNINNSDMHDELRWKNEDNCNKDDENILLTESLSASHLMSVSSCFPSSSVVKKRKDSDATVVLSPKEKLDLSAFTLVAREHEKLVVPSQVNAENSSYSLKEEKNSGKVNYLAEKRSVGESKELNCRDDEKENTDNSENKENCSKERNNDENVLINDNGRNEEIDAEKMKKRVKKNNNNKVKEKEIKVDGKHRIVKKQKIVQKKEEVESGCSSDNSHEKTGDDDDVIKKNKKSLELKTKQQKEKEKDDQQILAGKREDDEGNDKKKKRRKGKSEGVAEVKKALDVKSIKSCRKEEKEKVKKKGLTTKKKLKENKKSKSSEEDSDTEDESSSNNDEEEEEEQQQQQQQQEEDKSETEKSIEVSKNKKKKERNSNDDTDDSDGSGDDSDSDGSDDDSDSNSNDDTDDSDSDSDGSDDDSDSDGSDDDSDSDDSDDDSDSNEKRKRANMKKEAQKDKLKKEKKKVNGNNIDNSLLLSDKKAKKKVETHQEKGTNFHNDKKVKSSTKLAKLACTNKEEQKIKNGEVLQAEQNSKLEEESTASSSSTINFLSAKKKKLKSH